MENKITFSRPKSMLAFDDSIVVLPQSGLLASSDEAAILDASTNFQFLIQDLAVSSEKDSLYKSLDLAWREAYKDGWDGAGSKSVAQSTKKISEYFIDLLPLEMNILPDIFPSGSGGIVFEWEHHGEDFTIVVDGRKVVYSRIAEEKRNKGMFVLKESVEEIIPILREMGIVRDEKVA